ncbi:interleukin-17D-like [Rhinophrynus dorsalis]
MKVLLSLILVLTWIHCQGHRIQCKDPSERYLRMKLSRVAPDAFLNLIKEDITPDVELKKCPVSVNHTSELIQDRSISPWSYRINEDLKRYPQEIIEAYCLCEGCISSHNKGKNSLISVPFYKDVLVLHKTNKCKKGKYVYKQRYIKVAQFCICQFN